MLQKNKKYTSMDPPQLLPPFADLLALKKYSAYFRLLTEKGIDWWLDFQFPCIALHLAPLTRELPGEVDPPSARFHFSTLCLSPGPSLQELDALFHTFLAEEDHEAACACVGLALSAIWENGREFNRYSM